MPGPESDKRLARNGLTNYYFLVRNTLQDEMLRQKYFGGDKEKKISKALKETSDWLDKNHMKAEKDEFWAQQTKLTAAVNPIMCAARFLGLENDTGSEGGDESDEETKGKVKETKGKVKSDEPANGKVKDKSTSSSSFGLAPVKGKGMGKYVSNALLGKQRTKPPEPLGPPPPHLMRRGPYVR
jgi:hypothetical protein